MARAKLTDEERKNQRKYYYANREKILAKRREYRKANREKIREYRKANREKILAKQRVRDRNRRRANGIKPRMKLSDEERKKRIRKRNREYREANHEKLRISGARRRLAKGIKPREKLLTDEERKERRCKQQRKWSTANPQYAHRWSTTNLEKRNGYNAGYRATKAKATTTIDCSRVQAVHAIAAWLRSMGENVHVDHVIPLDKGGPHVWWNLRIIPAAENARKGSKMPELADLKGTVTDEALEHIRCWMQDDAA